MTAASALKMKLRAERDVAKATAQLKEAQRRLDEAVTLLAQAKRVPPSARTNPRLLASYFACVRPPADILSTFWLQAQQIVELLTPESAPTAVYSGAQIIKCLAGLPTDQLPVDVFAQMRSRFLAPYILKVPVRSFLPEFRC